MTSKRKRYNIVKIYHYNLYIFNRRQNMYCSPVIEVQGWWYIHLHNYAENIKMVCNALI